MHRCNNQNVVDVYNTFPREKKLVGEVKMILFLGAGVKRRQTRENASMQQPKRGRRVQYIPEREEIGGRSKNDIISCYAIEFRDNTDDKHILGDISNAIHAFVKTIRNYQKEHNALKFKLVLKAVFEKATDPEVITEPAVAVHTENIEVYQATNILEEL